MLILLLVPSKYVAVNHKLDNQTTPSLSEPINGSCFNISGNTVFSSLMVLNEHITTIIFDLGGVLLNLDYMRTQNAFEELGLSNFAQVYTQHQQSGLFDQFETGMINGVQFITSLQKTIPNASSEEITDAWNAMLLDFPQNRMDLLHSLKQDYTLVLFSNTNEIHYDAFNAILDDAKLPRLPEVFHHTLFSHKIGLRKPESAGFDFAAKLAGSNPNACLFIDDSYQHIQGARTLGVHTYHLKTMEQDVLSLFPGRVQ